MRRNTAGMYTAARDDRLRPARRQVHSVLFQIRLQSFISEAVRSRRRSLCWVLGDWRQQVDPPARTVLRPVRQCQVRLSRAFTVARLMQLICVLIVSCYFCETFSSLTLLSGRRERHPVLLREFQQFPKVYFWGPSLTWSNVSLEILLGERTIKNINSSLRAACFAYRRVVYQLLNFCSFLILLAGFH